ncbi:MAG: ABC transporter substrate-binding protein [Clostridia bacterium]|nr:ABC transporter substrate-binding protein [Clostridia bacterium]
MIKKSILLSVLFLSLLMLFSCTSEKDESNEEALTKSITDTLGNTAYIPENPRVASCYGSFAECWLLSGGGLVGVTDDAVNERGLDLPKETEIIGTVKEINLEKLVSLSPDYVILSADVAAHISLRESLDTLGIKYGYFRVDTLGDYAEMMRKFCDFSGRADLYEKHVTAVTESIDEITSQAPKDAKPTYLLMRAYSTGIKVKNDNIADTMLKELGAVSIVDGTPSLLTDLSVEQVIKSDPDYIFVLTMGDEKAGEEYFRTNIAENPAWSGLSAIKNGNCHILPKDLFHYKPNNRWDESYMCLAKILYPENLTDNE